MALEEKTPKTGSTPLYQQSFINETYRSYGHAQKDLPKSVCTSTAVVPDPLPRTYSFGYEDSRKHTKGPS
jgi:hypothetical protein